MESPHILLEMLKTVSIFSGLNDADLHLVQEKIQTATFAPEDVLCREGDAGDRMFIIQSGTVAVLKRGADNQPVEIAILQAGEIAGELSLFGRTTRSATLQARTRTTVWTLDNETFQHLLDQNGALSMTLLAQLSTQLRERSEKVAQLLSDNVDEYQPTFWAEVEQMAKAHYCPRLVVYVVWHPDYQDGQALAEHLYSRLRRDVNHPLSRGIGIPVFFRNALLPDTGQPVPIDLQDAQHSAVIVLVDDNLVVDDDWGDYVANLWRQMQVPNCPHRLFPVSLSPQAFNLDSSVPAVNFIRLHTVAENNWPSYLMGSVIHELCRLLLNKSRVAASGTTAISNAPVKLFISHAKRDGLEIAEVIRDYIHQNTALKTFFDAADIAAGYSFADEITGQLGDSAILAIQTDAYVSREWCQREIITAKRLDRPIVVVNALQDGEERGFPYLGNVPTVRWHAARYQNDPEARHLAIQAIIDLMLSEVLKALYLQQHFEDLRSLLLIPGRALLLSKPPELLSLLQLKEETAHIDMVVYPDPPLGDEEIKLLTTLVPDVQFKTPTLLWR